MFAQYEKQFFFIFWKNLLNNPGAGEFAGFEILFVQYEKNIFFYILKNLLNKSGTGWFTKGAPGFLSRFHQWLLKIPGAGWFARFEIFFTQYEYIYIYIYTYSEKIY